MLTSRTDHTFSYSPFRDVNGAILGFRNFSYETTASVIAARRVDTVRDLIAATSLARNVSGKPFSSVLLRVLLFTPADLIPLARQTSLASLSSHFHPTLSIYLSSSYTRPRRFKSSELLEKFGTTRARRARASSSRVRCV